MSTDEVTEKASLTVGRSSAPGCRDRHPVGGSCRALLESRASKALTGYTLEALGGLDLIEIFEPAETMHQVLLRVHAGESPVSVRLQLRTADGRRLPVEVQCAPLRSLDCSKARIVLVIREVAPLQAWRHDETRLASLGATRGGVVA